MADVVSAKLSLLHNGQNGKAGAQSHNIGDYRKLSFVNVPFAVEASKRGVLRARLPLHSVVRPSW